MEDFPEIFHYPTELFLGGTTAYPAQVAEQGVQPDGLPPTDVVEGARAYPIILAKAKDVKGGVGLNEFPMD